MLQGPGRAPRRASPCMAGCAQPVLAPEINGAAIRLLNRLGVEVVDLGRQRLLRGAAAPPGQDRTVPRPGGGQHRRLDPRDGGRRPGRHRDHRLGLRHDGEGLRLHVPGRSEAGRSRAACGLGHPRGRQRDPARGLEPRPVGRLGSGHPRCLSIRPVRCSTANRCARSPRPCCARRASPWSSRPSRISAAGRRAPTTCCSRRSPGGCATARWPIWRPPSRT